MTVGVDGVTVVALLIDTERAPFVVKNSAGGHIDHEVPWREGTATRSARRSDLVRLLAPVVHLPAAEVRTSTVTLVERISEQGAEQHLWEVATVLYIVPGSPETIVVPDHYCRASIAAPAIGLRIELGSAYLGAPGEPGGVALHRREVTPRLFSAARGHAQIIIEGPGIVYFRASTRTPAQPDHPTAHRVELQLEFRSAGSERPVVVEIALDRGDTHGGELTRWEVGK